MTSVIEFSDVGRRLLGERASKLLHPQSKLVTRLEYMRRRLEEKYATLIEPQKEAWCVPVVRPPEMSARETTDIADARLLRRAKLLHDQHVDTHNLGMLGSALVVWGPDLPGYGVTHIVVARFRPPSLEDIRNVVL